MLERRPQHLVDERRDGAERGAARPEHRGVQALQQLPGDVERDVRPRLEVRADRPDRDPPLADDEAVRRASALPISRSSGSSAAVAATCARERVEPRRRRAAAGRACPRRARPWRPRRRRRSPRARLARRSREHGRGLGQRGGDRVVATAPRPPLPRPAPPARSRARIGTFVCIVASAGGRSPLTSREAEGTGPTTPRQPAPTRRQGAKPGEPRGSKDVERRERRSPLSATALRCRNCETEHALEAVGVCSRCWGPLDPVYDWDELARTVSREAIAAGPPSHLALRRPAARRARPAEQRLAPGLTPLVARADDSPSSGRRRRALPEARHSQPDPLVQGPGRRGRRRQGAGARPDDARLLVDRQPRQRGRRARGRRGARGGRLLPGRPRAGEARPRPPSTARRSTRSRHVRRLQPADDRALVRAAVGVRQRRPAQLLRRGLEDARRSRSPSSSAGTLPDVVVAPDRLRVAVHEAAPGLREQLLELGLSRGACRGCSAARRRAARRSRPRSHDGAHGQAGPARHGRPVARDRRSRRRRPRGRDRPRHGRRDPRGRRRRRSARTWRCSPRRPASSARRRRASRSARCARRSPPARSVRTTASCSLVTGDGLKTPGPVAERLRPVQIEADADALLDRLQPHELGNTFLPKVTLLFELFG